MVIQFVLEIPRQEPIRSSTRRTIVQAHTRHVLHEALIHRTPAVRHTAIMLAVINRRMEAPHRQGIWHRHRYEGLKPRQSNMDRPSSTMAAYADLEQLKTRSQNIWSTRESHLLNDK